MHMMFVVRGSVETKRVVAPWFFVQIGEQYEGLAHLSYCSHYLFFSKPGQYPGNVADHFSAFMCRSLTIYIPDVAGITVNESLVPVDSESIGL
jgi:hypothetical protein